MKRIKFGVLAGAIALFMAFSSANTVALADEADAKNVVVEDEEWEKNAGSEPVNLNNVTAKELIVESGNENVLRINGGTIETVSVVAPKLDAIGYEEIVALLELGMPAEDVAQMYRDYLAEKAEVNETRPTIKLAGDAVIEEMVVSAGATLNLAGGEVKEVVVNNNNNSDMLTITIQNYDGKVSVDQKTNADGTANLITVNLKNSNLSELEVVGQESCSFFIEGDKASNVEAVTVNGSGALTMNVQAKDVLVAEGAENSTVRIYADAENVVVAANNCDFVVAASAKVQYAKVDGDNVDVKYAGDIENAEVNGTGSEVSYAPVTPVPKPTKAPTPTPVPKPEGTVVGNEDNTTGWWTAHSNTYKVEEGASKTITFWNYTNGLQNWNNWVVILQNVPDVHNNLVNTDYREYLVGRADNFGWGESYEGTTLESNAWSDWATWLANMDGAKVELTVTNNGDTADVVANVTTESGREYYQKYLGVAIEPGDLYFCLTVEGGHLIIQEPEEDTETPGTEDTETPGTEDTETPGTDEEPEVEYEIPAGTVIGAEDFSTGWWTVWSEGVKVKAGESKTVTFKNYTKGEGNWQNFVVVLKNVPGFETGYSEYAVVRADNWGWGTGYDGIVTPESNWDWSNDGAVFRADMNGATVVLTINNNGTTADVLADITTADGKVYYQYYKGIKVDGDIYYCLSVEAAYLVIE